MLKYILKRLGLCVLILLGVTLIIYFLVRCMPVDFVQNQINAINATGSTASEELVKAMYEEYGLGDNSIGGILKGYFNWLKDTVTFDLGTSFISRRPVIDEIRSHMGVSFGVALAATILEFMIAIPLGITAATHQYSIRDYVVTVFVMIGISLPAFFFGRVIIMAGYSAFGLTPGPWDETLKGGAFLWSVVKQTMLPVITVTVLSIGGRMRMTRTNMLEVMNSDYIRTARAKGLGERKVIYKHAFRNTLIPLVTSLAGLLPTLFSGAMITEQVFDLPGIGKLALDSMTRADIPFIMGYNTFLALLSVLGILLADLMYAVVDPRVKLS